MGDVINIENYFPKCRYEVKNIHVIDLLKPEYFEIEKYFKDRRKWTTEQKNNFIESLLFGFIAPSIFIYQDKDNNRFIIDGFNRIKTINEFINNEFSLEKMSKYNWFNNGKIYSRLNENVKYKFDACPVIINLVTKANEYDLKKLYMNLNI